MAGYLFKYTYIMKIKCNLVLHTANAASTTPAPFDSVREALRHAKFSGYTSYTIFDQPVRNIIKQGFC